MGQSINSINTLTSKINDFVVSRSKNIKFEIEGYKIEMTKLEEQVQAEKIAKERVQEELDASCKRAN